jgi:transcriptional regulator with XRE-family HTH domain
MALCRNLIKQRREQLGLDSADVARRIGVSIHEYCDVEWYEDELVTVLPLKNARSLAALLGFELETFLGARPLAGRSRASAKPRHIALAEARDRLGVSASKMAKDIGFEEAFVHRIENDGRTLETYPYEVLRIVADYLKLDPADLLHTPSA